VELAVQVAVHQLVVVVVVLAEEQHKMLVA
jgi:hypothetical protein